MSAGGDLEVTGTALAGTGAAATAGLAAACCVPIVSPLLVTALGASGAVWLAGLQPYAPWLLAGSLALLAYGFWSLYGRRRRCRADAPPGKARRLLARVSVVLLWSSAVAWVAATASYVVGAP